MKHRNRRITAAVVSAAMSAVVVMASPAWQVFAQCGADLYFQQMGVSNLTYNGGFYSGTLYSNSNQDTHLPNNRTTSCTVAYYGQKNYFLDPNRKIRLVGSANCNINAEYKRYPLKQRVFDASVNPAKRNMYIALMHNVGYAYDYYQSIGFGGYSYTGYEIDPDTGTLGDSLVTDPVIYVAVVDGQCPGDNGRLGMVPFDQTNATAEHALIATGMGDQNRRFTLADTDIAVHEMGHLLAEQIIGWDSYTYSGETGSLMEAYSDIFAELSDPTPDWMIGTDVFYGNDSGSKKYCIRNIADPNNYNQPEFEERARRGEPTGKEVFYTDYPTYRAAYQANDNNIEYNPYRGSTVISHAAYVMAKSVPKKDLGRIWLQSMNRYSPRIRFVANFADCRRAVESAAQDYLFTQYRTSPNTAAAYLEAIVKAFDEARIPTSHQTALTQKQAESSSNMSSFIASEKSSLGNGRYWTTGYPDTSTSVAPSGENHSTVMQGGPLLLPKFYRSNWQYEEAYYQCAGFAKKLQVDYFGTSIALRNDDESVYKPKVGDHLRIYYPIAHGPVDRLSHSIFITSVSGSTFQYADCNSDGKCKILWNQSGSFTKSNGVYTFNIGGTSYKFEWVERPIKLGDVNADGVLSSSDVSEMTRIISGSSTSSQVDRYYRTLAAVVNGDGVVNSSDKTLVSRLVNNTYSTRSTYGFVK